MIIIGIDPSMANTAIVAMDERKNLVLDWVLIETKKSSSKQVRASSDAIGRARNILHEYRAFVQQFKVSLTAAETPSGSQSSSGMKSYGMVCMFLAGIEPLIEVTPAEVKGAAVGDITASKADMIAWAMETHPEVDWPMNKSKGTPLAKCEHIADAIAVIYAARKTQIYKALRNLI